MRWGETLTLEFVKLYLKQECLWNPDHSGYKLKHEREKCYRSIGADFEAYSGKRLNIPEIKNKIKNLRSTYIQQVQKILRKSSPDEMYEPSLVWFHEMDRCLKHLPMNVKQSIVTKYQQEAEEVDSSTQMWLDPEALDEKADEENPDPLSSQTDEECLLNPEEVIIKKEHRNSFKKIKKKKFKHRSSFHVPSSNSNGREDEFDIYGKFIATQLRQMNLQKALKLQLEIQNLVSEARISELS